MHFEGKKGAGYIFPDPLLVACKVYRRTKNMTTL